MSPRACRLRLSAVLARAQSRSRPRTDGCSVTAESRELVIVGGGPAGLAAALEARRAGVQVTLIEERATLGGQIYKQPPGAFAVRQPRALGKEYVAGRALVERTLRSGAELLTDHAVWNVWGRGPF